ncbi:hypothetical protein SROCM77S_04803 [Streptomyces rochei]|uniref:hypothetical protein n=1 Tax=Streptomyces sp. NRRL WC-3795 TaxID=1463938 RepID=UPI0004C8FB47|nr:hypothetical protein [Streptomyces sp. NRRL WC-3795]
MEPTGHSTDFVVDASFPEAMARFVRRAERRWPGLYVNGEPLAPSASASWRLPPSDDDAPGIVTFSAGRHMEDFWEEHGYATDATGQGPFSVFHRLHPHALRAETVSGVRSDSPDAEAAAEGTRLLLTWFHAVSLVTPGDPDVDPFSAEVLDDFLASYAAPDRPRV